MPSPQWNNCFSNWAHAFYMKVSRTNAQWELILTFHVMAIWEEDRGGARKNKVGEKRYKQTESWSWGETWGFRFSRTSKTQTHWLSGVPAMGTGIASHCHIYCWSVFLPGIMPKKQENLGPGMRGVWGHRKLTPIPTGSTVPNSLFSYHFCTWYHEFSIQPAHFGGLEKTKTNCFSPLFIPLAHSGIWFQKKN